MAQTATVLKPLDGKDHGHPLSATVAVQLWAPRSTSFQASSRSKGSSWKGPKGTVGGRAGRQ